MSYKTISDSPKIDPIEDQSILLGDEPKEENEDIEIAGLGSSQGKVQPSQKFKLIIGGFTALLLTSIYSYMIIVMISSAGEEFNVSLVPIWSSVVTTIGGLISAVIVAIFAATPSNQPMFEGERLPYSVVICLFTAVWFGVGVFTFFKGTLNPPVNSEFQEILSYLGMNWLVTAVAGTYAFLGLNPPEDP